MHPEALTQIWTRLARADVQNHLSEPKRLLDILKDILLTSVDKNIPKRDGVEDTNRIFIGDFINKGAIPVNDF